MSVVYGERIGAGSATFEDMAGITLILAVEQELDVAAGRMSPFRLLLRKLRKEIGQLRGSAQAAGLQ